MYQTEEEEIKSGTLYLRDSGLTGKSWNERWFVLYGSTLYYFKNAKDAAGVVGASAMKKKSKGNVAINKTSRVRSEGDFDPPLNDVPFRDSAFQIVNIGSSTVSICATSPDSSADWVNVIEQTIQGRKDLNRETVSIIEDLRKAEFQLHPEDLVFVDDVVGQGASGVVRKGKWLGTTEVAVKLLKNLPEFTDSREMTSFYKEIETLSKMHHSHIVQMYGFCRKDNYLCLVTEYVKGGNLSQCLKDRENFQMDIPKTIELAMNICTGMIYLHSRKVIHRDLKPANILIENWNDARTKVCDFGISRGLSKTSIEVEEGSMGSPQYAAPELANQDHDNRVDVFSFAIILWEMAFRESPWPEIRFGWEFSERYGAGQRPHLDENNLFSPLIAKCWQKDPASRPPFSQIHRDLEALQIKHTQMSTGQPLVRSNPLPRHHMTESSVVPPGRQNMTQSGQTTLSFPNHFARTTPPRVPQKFSSGSASQLERPGSTSFPKPLAPLSLQSLGPTSPKNGPTSPNFSEQPKSPQSGPIYSGLDGQRPPQSPPAPMRSERTNANFPRSGGSSFQRQYTPPSLMSVEDKVGQVFNGGDSAAWKPFSERLAQATGVSVAKIEKARYVLESAPNVVNRMDWEKFASWFFPLSGPQNPNGGWSMDHILEIVSLPYFHGFMDMKDAQKTLKGIPEGTYLLRFSTQQSYYTLSVSYSGTVGHWRIQTEKKPGQRPEFKVETRSYDSLEHVVMTHSPGRGDPLLIKQPKPGQSDKCYLTAPLTRTSQGGEAYYQVV
eukprot:TRINITY_DN6173_c0_g1_i2.p1 TRINITY_DN6173_c0_g1~~TRINITY_DN6173_c0_g1_i2.p1  ORF type:complete len:778 (+),score=161.64 TRINITY_DN6173_c0_g1_i2:127-2460(+)